ncbi:MAG: hypothetical protein JWO18_2893, partial [Microbacteriaceae bacterium]|nr:hypothetical protein [Microbacteriaceae bacterium]
MATRGRQSDEHGTYSDSEGDVDLIDTPSEDLASSLPESLTIEVSLPNTVHAAPEDELAVAIVEVPVNPGFVEVTEPTTTSIMVVPPVPEAEPEPEAPYIPELPSSDDRALSRRDRMRGEVSNAPEVAGMLTADRLINVRRKKRAKPEGGLNAFLYAITFHAVNRGDSPKVRARKAIEARIDKKFEGGARFIPVLTRKGGVGKTTITALLGMALSDTREDRVIAID